MVRDKHGNIIGEASAVARMPTTMLTILVVSACALLTGCPVPADRVTSTQALPPVEPGNVPPPEQVAAESKPAVSPDQVPSNRVQFEAWVRETSPHAPQTTDEEQAVAALEQWLRTECEMKELVLLPAPLWESRQMPDKYYEWYKEDELGVYLWDDREPPDLKLIVGPPEACAWCVAHMGKEDGKWVLMKATTSHDEAVDEVIYQRGKGFITREKEPDD